MKNFFLSLLIAVPCLLHGQFGLELGSSAFSSDLGFSGVSAETFGGIYGQANLKLGSVLISLSTDINTYSEGSASTAVVALKLGFQSSFELGGSGRLFLHPGVKLGSYGIGYASNSSSTLSEGHLGVASSVDFVAMLGTSLGLTLGLDYNILFEGELEGIPVDGFNYLEPNLGLRFYFGDPRVSG